MKIAIMGANSYIARNLIYFIKEKANGDVLYLYDRDERHFDKNDNYTKIDVLNRDEWSSVNMKCDVIYFFVGKTGTVAGFDDPESFLDVNERSLLMFLDECQRRKTKAKIVFPSTRLVYNDNSDARESDASDILKTIYAVNKAACEYYIKAYHNAFDLNYCIFRIGIPYGSMVSGCSSYGTVEYLLNDAKHKGEITLYGDGRQRRTITHIKDICRVLYMGGANELCSNEIYNIGGENYSLLEMAELVANRYHASINHIDFPNKEYRIESWDTVFNDEKLRGRLGELVSSTNYAEWIKDRGRV